MPRKIYTREFLEPLVKSSTSFSQVIRKIGLVPTGGNHRQISGRIREAGLDTSHFFGRISAQIAALRIDELREVVARSLSVAQVLGHFGLPRTGRPCDQMTKRLREDSVDTSHFRGQGWSRGETVETNASVAVVARKLTLPDEVVFTENSPIVGAAGRSLVKRLLAKGWMYQCAICGICEWQGKRLVLHLDHINGTHNDNRLVNLRLLCPNCHSQTDTYCNKTRPSGASQASEPRLAYSCYTNATRAWRNRYPREF